MFASQRSTRHHLTAVARFNAGKQKPPTRKQAQAWLAPIRKAFAVMMTGEIDANRGYPVTRINQHDHDYARVDYCINGFTAMMARLMPDFNVASMTSVSKKLAAGIMLTHAEIEACLTTLKHCEDRLIKFKRADLIDASMAEQINIELERIGLKEAA